MLISAAHDPEGYQRSGATQYPATSLSTNGPMNQLQAVAASPETAGKGVMIVMNGHILDARSAMKTNTLSVESFKSPSRGIMGYTNGVDVHFLS